MNSFYFPEDLKMFPEPIYGVVDRAVVQGRIWRVRFNGSYWFAKLHHPNQKTAFEPGQRVRVVAMQGITLLIASIEPSRRE